MPVQRIFIKCRVHEKNSCKNMHIFYEPQIINNGNFLNEEESFHCIKVLRHKVGDIISVIDGTGNNFLCEILDFQTNRCRIKIKEKIVSETPESKCHIAVAPTKNIDRFEWFIEKSAEIGIREITPVIFKHSERKIIKPERLEKIITSAIKQSMSLWRPILNPIVDFDSFLIMSSQLHKTQKFIAYCNDKSRIPLKDIYKVNNDVIIMIGPEGDLDKTEIENAFEKEFTGISLGDSRLRTETAALVACHTIQLLNSRR